MARANIPRNYFTFVGGKVSDINAVNPPPNTARVMTNVDLEANGKISRRLGIDLEDNFVLDTGPYSDAFLRSSAVNTFEWLNVAESNSAAFLAVRVANEIHFYDESSVPFSNGLLGTLDISNFLSDASIGMKRDVQMSSGRGNLFVTGEGYNPFKVSYDSFTNTFTGEEVIILIRDFAGLDDGLAVDKRPSSLSSAHEYNLRNQGWSSSRITSFNSSQGVFPSNSDIEFLGFKTNEDGDRVFSPNEIINHTLGNTKAPSGHFILDAFREDRLSASGIFGLPTGGTTFRPHSTAFFAGRVWFASVKGKIYFSQILESDSNIGRCYQDQDASSEELNELLDTDGGVINIPQAGVVEKLVATGQGLAVLASNGVWLISGGDTGFTANATLVDRIAQVKISNGNSVVEADGSIYFWSEEGIFVLVPDQVSGRLSPTSLTDNRIKKDYNNIPAISKKHAQGVYDRVQKRIYWSYHDGQTSGAASLDSKFNSAIVFDTAIGAFWDYFIEDLDATVDVPAPFMAGMVKRSAVNEGSDTDVVVVNGEQVEVNGEVVTTDTFFVGASDVALKILSFVFDVASMGMKITFSEFCSRSFKDWFTVDSTGKDYDSNVETNPELLGEGSVEKQATYLYTFYDFQRGGFGELLFTPRFDPTEGFRNSQTPVEALVVNSGLFRNSQTPVEALVLVEANMRASQVPVEILRNV